MSQPPNPLKSDFYLVIDENLCKGCNYCVNECPKGVLALRQAVSKRGYNLAYLLYPDRCIKCRKCEYCCPEMAISLERDAAHECH